MKSAKNGFIKLCMGLVAYTGSIKAGHKKIKKMKQNHERNLMAIDHEVQIVKQ